MRKDCMTCRYKSKSSAEKPCTECIITKYKGNTIVGVEYTEWESDDKK